jgi:hypothetical protein
MPFSRMAVLAGRLSATKARYNDFGGSVGGVQSSRISFLLFLLRDHSQPRHSVFARWFETPQLLALAPGGSAASLFATFPGASPFGDVKEAAGDNHACTDIGLTTSNCRFIEGQGLDVGKP